MRMRSLMTHASSRNPSSVLKRPLDQHDLGCIASLYLCPTNCQLLATPLLQTQSILQPNTAVSEV